MKDKNGLRKITIEKVGSELTGSELFLRMSVIIPERFENEKKILL